MTYKEKATEILEKINNSKISKEDWEKASDYAKSDLKRKALIVVDEIIYFMDSFDIDIDYPHQFKWWKQVRDEIDAF